MSFGIVLILGIELYILLPVCLYGLMCLSFIQPTLNVLNYIRALLMALISLNP